MTTHKAVLWQRWLRLVSGLVIVVSSVTMVALPANAAPAPTPPAAPTTPANPANPGATDPNAGTSATTPDSTNDPSTNQPTNEEGNDAVSGVTALFGQSARSSLAAALNRLGLWTSPVVKQNADPNHPNWFVSHYRMMRVMGLYLMMPLVLIAIIHAITKASLAMLLKTVFMFLPLAILGTAAAIDFVQLLLNVTDDFSAVFINAILADSNTFFKLVNDAFGDKGGIPFMLNLLLGLMLGIVCVFVYVIMIVRESSIYVATSFLPIGFAMLVWPSTSKWFKRMVEFLFGIILSKIIMVAAISLAIAALAAPLNGGHDAGSTGLDVNGKSVSTAGVVAGKDNALNEVSNIIAAIALMFIVLFAPSMTIGLVGKLGIGEMASHVGTALTRPSGMSLVLMSDRLNYNKKNAVRLVQNVSGRGESMDRAWGRKSVTEQRLNAVGIHRNEHGNFALTARQLTDAGVDAKYHATLINMTNPNLNGDNANAILMAHSAMGMGENFDGFLTDKSPANVLGTTHGDLGTVLLAKDGRSKVMVNITDNKGRDIQHISKAMIRKVVAAEADRQIAITGGVQAIDVIMPTRTRVSAGRSVAQAGVENRLERDVNDAVRDVRHRYERTDPGAPRVDINAQFRAPASVHSRVYRPGSTQAAEEAESRF